MSSSTPPPSTIPRKQQIKFNHGEDVALCEAHIEVTCDGSVAAMQGRARYWDRIVPLFIQKIKDNVNDRDKGGLENRICTIKKDMKLYVGILSKLYRGAKSGWSTEDLLMHAHIEFQKIHKRPFQFDHCYDLYKHQPGYNYTENVDVPLAPPPSDIQDVDTDNADVQREVGDGVGEKKDQRAPGKKKLKALKRAKYVGDMSSDCSIESQFSQSNEKMFTYLHDQEEQIKKDYDIREEKIRVREERKEMKEERDREDRIMMTDLSKLSSMGREWIQMQQQEILEKRRNMQQ